SLRSSPERTMRRSKPGPTTRRTNKRRPATSCRATRGGSTWVSEERVETGFVERRHAELLGLRELRAGAVAEHDVARLLRDAPRDLSAARDDRGRGFVTRVTFERSGEHERHARERLVDQLDRGARVAGEIHAGCLQSLDKT